MDHGRLGLGNHPEWVASADSVRAVVPIEREDGPAALAPRRTPPGWYRAGFVLDRSGLPCVANLVVPWPPLHGNVIPRAIHGAQVRRSGENLSGRRLRPHFRLPSGSLDTAMPSARRFSMALASRSSSAKISRVCSPTWGARYRGEGGDPPKSAGVASIGKCAC